MDPCLWLMTELSRISFLLVFPKTPDLHRFQNNVRPTRLEERFWEQRRARSTAWWCTLAEHRASCRVWAKRTRRLLEVRCEELNLSVKIRKWRLLWSPPGGGGINLEEWEKVMWVSSRKRSTGLTAELLWFHSSQQVCGTCVMESQSWPGCRPRTTGLMTTGKIFYSCLLGAKRGNRSRRNSWMFLVNILVAGWLIVSKMM